MNRLRWTGIFVLTVTICSALVLQRAPADEPIAADVFPAVNYPGPLKLPKIVRFSSLPMRMNLEPELAPPEQRREIDPRHPTLFDRMLREADDGELQQLAGESLARVAREQLADISPSYDILLSHLKETEYPTLKQACAMALTAADCRQAAAELLQAAAQGDDQLRLVIEPALWRWKYEPAAEMWKSRTGDRFATQISVRLACEGLAALQVTGVVPALAELLQNESASIGKRLAAAAALSHLNAAQAFELSRRYRAGSIYERLLCVALLNSSEADSLTALTDYCRDPSNGVASAAWKAIQQHDPARLVVHLDYGRQHNDAGIRIIAAETMRLFPDEERCGWLNDLISDFNLEVRNVARNALERTAAAHPELKPTVVKAAAAKLVDRPEDWQGIEQSLVLLGQLTSTQHSESCAALLTHPRPEVSVTAAWLLHLFPEPKVQDAVLSRIELLYQQRDSQDPQLMQDFGTATLQLAHLSLYAGILRLQSVQPLLEKNFSKAFPASEEERSAAMWALGLIHFNNPDPALAGKFASRIQDRDGIPPELMIVRQMSVRALGLLRATDSAEVLREAYRIDDSMSLIPEAARWSLVQLGEKRPPALETISLSVGGWKLNPTVP